MTPRAWSYGLLFAGILAALAFFAALLLAAQTVGVEAWHDSAVPAGAFVVIRSAGVSTPAPTLHQPRTPSPVAASSSRGRPHPATPVRESPVGSAAVQPALTKTGLSESMTGISSWYAYVAGQAAAGPALRAALSPGWRGSRITVCAGACVPVVLTDACQCYGSRLIDLDRSDFARLGDPSLGLLNVEVSW